MGGEGLGALGFWLMIGMIIAASILKDGLKEREKQAMLRALLEKEGESVTEVLAYLRERDAAQAASSARLRAESAATRRRLKPVAMGILAFVAVIVAGYLVGVSLHFALGSDSRIPGIPLFGGLAAAPIVAWLVWRSGKRKNDAHPDA